MEFAFSDEQEMLRDTARRFLETAASSDAVRTVMETEEGFDPDVWSSMADLGWQAMAIPEEHGGAGFSFVEMAILVEEMGRVLLPTPYLSSVVLAAGLIADLGTDDQKAELLGSIASGERRVAVAHLESGDWGASGVEMVAREDGAELVLDGTKSYVLDGHTADTLLVVARSEGSAGSDGVSVVVVDGDAAGVSRTRVETMDMTRKQATVVFDGVRVPASAVLGEAGSAWPAIERTLDRAAVALAFEQVGGAQRCLEMSVDYAKTRVQFGRPIGSFQAVKHTCADMLVHVEAAKTAAYYAGWAITDDDSDVPIAVTLAKTTCSEAFFRCAADTIQVHGGIGFTWEHDAHLYLKRAKTDELLFGAPSLYRARLAQLLGV